MPTALIMMIASYILQTVFGPKQKAPEPVAFKDIDFPQTEDGTPQAVVFGDCWIQDWAVLAVGNYRTEAFKIKGGGKK